jgi:hypothetical protein
MKRRYTELDLAAQLTPADEIPSPVFTESAPGDQETRHRMIAEAAYFLAEARGFAPGYELEDWLAAETGIDHVLTFVDYRTTRV